MALFQVAALFIASTGFFPNALYSDAFNIGEDPENLKTADQVFAALIADPVTKGPIKILGNSVGGFTALVIILVTIGGVAVAVTKQASMLSIPIIGLLFYSMWANSRTVFESLASGLDSSVNYLIIMIGLGMLIMFVITLLDYLSGQHAGG